MSYVWLDSCNHIKTKLPNNIKFNINIVHSVQILQHVAIFNFYVKYYLSFKILNITILNCKFHDK